VIASKAARTLLLRMDRQSGNYYSSSGIVEGNMIKKSKVKIFL
jgi:hypothetical protein